MFLILTLSQFSWCITSKFTSIILIHWFPWLSSSDPAFLIRLFHFSYACIIQAKKSAIIAAICVLSLSKIPGFCLFFSLFTLPNSLLYIFSYLHVWYIKSWWIRENDSIKWLVKKLKQKNKQKPGIFEWLRTQIAAIIADFLACVIQAL